MKKSKTYLRKKSKSKTYLRKKSKSKTYLRKTYSKKTYPKKTLRKRKGGFPLDIIDYNSPNMSNYNMNYLEKGYLNL
jgi:hypothetical protein